MEWRYAVIKLIISLFLIPFSIFAADYTALTDGQNWALVDNIEEMSTVANEISSVLSASTSGTNIIPEIGDNAGAASFSPTKWIPVDMQVLIINRYDDFWHGGVVLEGQTNFYLVVDNPPTHGGVYSNSYSIADFYLAAGISSNGFRRAQTNMPTDWTDLNDAHYTYGEISAGDIIGPWNFDDIQKCFSTMTQLVWTSGFLFEDYPSVTNVYSGSSGFASDNWGDETAEVATNYTGTSSNQGATPQARYTGIADSDTNYVASALTAVNTAIDIIYGSNITRNVSFLARTGFTFGVGTNINNTFDANGSIAVENEWVLISLAEVTPTIQSHTEYSDAMGNNDLPSEATQPAADLTEHKGWRIEADEPAVTIQDFTWSYMR